MKVIKFFGSPNNGHFSLQGIKTLYDDGFSRNDLQTTMAVIQWLNALSHITDILSWLWDNNTPMLWDDGSPILLD